MADLKNSKNPQLVVMAAGIGSRYGGLKQIDPIGPSGEIVIDYAVYDAIQAGFDKVIFIIRKEIEDAFRDKVGKTIESRIETEYVFQELDDLPAGFSPPADRTKPWGTGHAVLAARNAISAPFAVINADDFYGAASFQAIADYLRSAEDVGGVYDFSMVGFVLDNTLTEHGHVARGVCTADDDGYLVSTVERTMIQRFGPDVKYSEDGGETWTAIPAGSVVSMNMWGFTPGFLAELEAGFAEFLAERIQEPKAEIFIPTVVNSLIQASRAKVKVLPTTEKWLGVTYQADKPLVIKAIREKVDQGTYPESLWG